MRALCLRLFLLLSGCDEPVCGNCGAPDMAVQELPDLAKHD
jgi:hypothetical protein